MTTELRTLLTPIAHGEYLTRDQAEAAMHAIMQGEPDATVLAGFLMGLRARGESVEELVGFTKVMREYAVSVECDPDAIDLCGTGGDGSGTFNISTAAAFVCAGAGVTVAKHGNRSVSSKCGSSDVLAALGVQTELRKEGVERCLDEAGIAFLFAPLFHPAMRHVMPVRRTLAARTFFNILGPLCNPARVRRQLVGAFSVDVARTMAEILLELEATKVVCVHSDDGLDEFSLAADASYFSFTAGDTSRAVATNRFTPASLGLARSQLSDLRGGDAKDNAAIIQNILRGEHGAPRDVVVLNAAFALSTTDNYDSIEAALAEAQESIDSGRALASLNKLVASSNAPS